MMALAKKKAPLTTISWVTWCPVHPWNVSNVQWSVDCFLFVKHPKSDFMSSILMINGFDQSVSGYFFFF